MRIFEQVGHERAQSFTSSEKQQMLIADIEWDMDQQVIAASQSLGQAHPPFAAIETPW